METSINKRYHKLAQTFSLVSLSPEFVKINQADETELLLKEI